MTENPYAAPESASTLTTEESDAEQVRREHLRTEASIRSIGTLYLVVGILIGVSVSSQMSSLLREFEGPERQGALVGIVGIPIILILVGWKLRKLSRAATIFAGIGSALGLLAFPVGTLINGLILYTLFCKKGRFVVTPAYKQIVAETPHIRYRTSIVTWVLLAILILLAVIGIAVALFKA